MDCVVILTHALPDFNFNISSTLQAKSPAKMTDKEKSSPSKVKVVDGKAKVTPEGSEVSGESPVSGSPAHESSRASGSPARSTPIIQVEDTHGECKSPTMFVCFVCFGLAFLFPVIGFNNRKDKCVCLITNFIAREDSIYVIWIFKV